jgi:hypothetical protein
VLGIYNEMSHVQTHKKMFVIEDKFIHNNYI